MVVIPSSPARSSLATKETEVTLFTDASSSGWGAQLGSRSTQGQWSASQRSCHINVLEMQAVIFAVRDFLPHLRYRVVRLMCDNAVSVAYIKNEGGTRSHTLMQMTIRLLKWCDSKAITLVPVHLPGVRNIQADALSRVLQKIAQSPGVQVILIAQLQPAASWFPELIDLSQEDPIPLFVEGQDLLTQEVCMGGGVTETRDRPSNLHAWKLSGPF